MSTTFCFGAFERYGTTISKHGAFTEERGKSMDHLLALRYCHKEDGDPPSSLHGSCEDKAVMGTENTRIRGPDSHWANGILNDDDSHLRCSPRKWSRNFAFGDITKDRNLCVPTRKTWFQGLPWNVSHTQRSTFSRIFSLTSESNYLS